MEDVYRIRYADDVEGKSRYTFEVQIKKIFAEKKKYWCFYILDCANANKIIYISEPYDCIENAIFNAGIQTYINALKKTKEMWRIGNEKNVR